MFTDLIQTDESGDHVLQSTAQFCLKGKAMVEEGVPFAKFLGDATHDEHKKLKKLLLGFAVTHFS